MISQFCLVSAVLASLRALGGGLGPSWGPVGAQLRLRELGGIGGDITGRNQEVQN